MKIEKAKEVFEALYKEVNGRALSLEGRETQQLNSKSFVYGEAVFDPFYELLKEGDPKPGTTFVDCGSGTGKAVFVGYFMFDFAKSVGVELLDNLYNASAQTLERFNKEFKPSLKSELGKKEIAFIHGNILDIDFGSVDMAFMNSTCFQEDLMEGLVAPVSAMKPNSILITLSKSMNSPDFDLYKQKTFDFSWGQGTAFYQRRKG